MVRPKSSSEDHDVEHSIGSSKRYKKAIDTSADELVCPLTLELPVDPVTAEDGKVYERMAIEEHMAKTGSDLKSPVTRELMGKRLFPALQVRNVIEQLVGSGAIEGDKAKRWNEEMEKRKMVADLQQKSESDDARAMYNLAVCYEYGDGVKQDPLVAYAWFKKAADGGHVKGAALAGWCLCEGVGVDSNIPLGMMLLGRAEGEGSDWAAYYLGTWFCAGAHGLPQDPIHGKRLLNKIVRGTCRIKHLSDESLEEVRNILRELDGPTASEPI